MPQPFVGPQRTPPNPAIFPRYFQNPQGLWLHWYEWWPPGVAAVDIKAVVFLSSGLGEHGGRYEGLAERLMKDLHCVVFSLDHQGHGTSDGERKYVESFWHYIDDYCLFIKTIYDKYNGSSGSGVDLSAYPRLILGHSMGGLIATHVVRRLGSGTLSDALTPNFILANKKNNETDGKKKKNFIFFDGVVLSGPAIAIDPGAASPSKVALVKKLANIFPRAELGGFLVGTICRNFQIVERALLDPLYPTDDGIKLKWAYEFLTGILDVWENIDDFTSLFVHQTAATAAAAAKVAAATNTRKNTSSNNHPEGSEMAAVAADDEVFAARNANISRLLLIHGRHDKLVPVDGSTRLFEALKTAKTVTHKDDPVNSKDNNKNITFKLYGEMFHETLNEEDDTARQDVVAFMKETLAQAKK